VLAAVEEGLWDCDFGVANSNGKEVRGHVKGAPGRPPGDFSLLLLAVVAVVVPAAAGGAAWAAHLGGK
jgi:hypothetical protein